MPELRSVNAKKKYLGVVVWGTQMLFCAAFTREYTARNWAEANCPVGCVWNAVPMRENHANGIIRLVAQANLLRDEARKEREKYEALPQEVREQEYDFSGPIEFDAINDAAYALFLADDEDARNSFFQEG